MPLVELNLPDSLLEDVQDIMAVVAKRPVPVEEALSFLARHPRILGNIIAYDEVDTEDRYAIWEALAEETSLHQKE